MRRGSRALGAVLVAWAVAVTGASIYNPSTPSGGGDGFVTCLVSNHEEWELGGTNCQYGTTINVPVNTAWHCNAALSTYGTLPIKVVSTWTASVDDNAITLDNNCTGDASSDTIDLGTYVLGEGPASGIGPQDDACKTRQSPGPHDIQITGMCDAGAPGGSSHPDCWQFQGGTNLALVNMVSGNYAAGTSTAQGAGGCPFWTNATDVDIIGGEYIACNHALNGNIAKLGDGNIVSGAKFRSGRTDGTDPQCTGFNDSPPCTNVQDLTLEAVVCQQWLSGSWQDVAPES